MERMDETGLIAGGRCLAAALRNGIDREESRALFRASATYFAKGISGSKSPGTAGALTPLASHASGFGLVGEAAKGV